MILCPECKHDIDLHVLHEPCADCWQTAAFDGSVDPCRQQPSDIARALLTAEPTGAEVEAGAREIHGFHGIYPWPLLTELSRDRWRNKARVVLRAARGGVS